MGIVTNKHLHKYKKVNIAKKGSDKYEVWKCQLPNCTHYLTKPQVVGRFCLCWVCGEECIVKRENDGAVRAKPHCPSCTKKIKPEGITDKMMKTLGI